MTKTISSNNVTINESCRACHSTKLTKVIDLDKQPPANAFLSLEHLNMPEEKFPLEVYFCEDCNLAQLIHIVDKNLLFRDYVYFSSLMPKLSDHFKKYAEEVMVSFLQPGDLVVELGSNDGVLLQHFKERGYRITGVDPARNIAKLANERGITTIPDFFNANIVEQIIVSSGKAGAIIGNNVIAHINDYDDLWSGIVKLLDTNGVFILEAPYLVDMFENLSFDTIYHEHLSYLAVRPLILQAKKFGLEVFDVQIVPSQGQSIRVFIGHRGEHEMHQNIQDLIEKELALGLDKQETYFELARKIADCKNRVVTFFQKKKTRGKKLAARGAPAKGNTILNYYGLDYNILDFVLDEIPTKQGFYTPGSHIPVVDKKYALDHLPDYYLLLAWNYAHLIIPNEKEFLTAGGTFVLPTGKIISAADVKQTIIP